MPETRRIWKGPTESGSATAALALWLFSFVFVLLFGRGEFFEWFDVHFLAEHSNLFGLDVADDVYEDRFLVAVKYGHDETFYSFLATRFQENRDIILAVFHGDDAFPSFARE